LRQVDSVIRFSYENRNFFVEKGRRKKEKHVERRQQGYSFGCIDMLNGFF